MKHFITSSQSLEQSTGIGRYPLCYFWGFTTPMQNLNYYRRKKAFLLYVRIKRNTFANALEIKLYIFQTLKLITMKKHLLFFLLLTIAIVGKASTSSLDMSKASIVSKTSGNGITYFKFLYPSVDADGNEIILSGLTVLPLHTSASTGNQTLPQNMIIGCHATITKDAECPSNFGAAGYPTNEVYALSFSAQGNDDITKVANNNLLVMADYIGYGKTKDLTHPYLNEDLTGRNIVDAARYGKALMETLTYEEDGVTKNYKMNDDNWKTVICGYSQGGSSAMAAQRYIEQNGYSDELHFLGSVCGGGPYSERIVVESYAKDGKLVLPMVAPLVISCLIESYPSMKNHTIDEYLNPTFINTGIIDWIAKKEMTLDEIMIALYQKGFTDYSIENIFNSDIVKCLKGEATSQAYTDLITAVDKNNMTVGWIPQHRIILFHSTTDNVVDVRNCTNFLDKYYTGNSGLVKTKMDSYGTHGETAIKFYSSPYWCMTLVNYLYTDAQTWSLLGDNYTPSSIENISINGDIPQNNMIYDLSGRSVKASRLATGIYIRDGRKFVVK